ncbi:MAG: hypothetical protein D6748_06675 [Calditrichaeota bacterium]|nr:MAG: hypothetical protein D6748_06675 [Calditrichota bacterium]
MKNYILILDTSTRELRRLRELLTGEGYDIMTASELETALLILAKVPVSLILCEPVFLKGVLDTKKKFPIRKKK